MKDTTGFNLKSKHTSNKLKLKSILSIFTMGLFILFGFASIEETPPVDNCEFYKTPISKTHIITIEIYDKVTGNPITANPDPEIEFDIAEYEKVVNSNFYCELPEKKSYYKTLNFGSSGKATLMLDTKTYLSKEDYISIVFKSVITGYNEELHFETIRDYNSNLTLRYGFLKYEKNP